MTPPAKSRPSIALGTIVLAGAVLISTIASAQSPAPAAPGVPATSAAPSDKQKAQAAGAYVAGAKALDHSDYAAAEKHFTRALTLNPDNHAYQVALAIAREHHVTDLVQHSGREHMLGHTARADDLLATARALDPENPIVTQHADPNTNIRTAPWLAQAPVFAGAIALTPKTAIKSFHSHTEVQAVVREVTSAFGIRPIFDDSVTHQSIRFDIDDVSYDQAMSILLHINHLFTVPLDATSILVARDTPDNRQRLERLMEEIVYVPGMTPEQMSDLGNVVRNIFDVKQATVENGLGNIVIRAPEQTLNALNLTLADLLDGTSEVLFDLKLYEIDITHQRTTGLSLPSQIGVYNVASQAQSLVAANQTIVNQAIAEGLIPATASILQIAEYLIGSGVAMSALLSSTIGIFGGGITTTGVYTTGSTTLNFGLNASDTRSLDEIQLRVTDRQPAEFRVGTRYPITTSTYSTGVVANASSLAGVSVNGVSASSLLSQLTGSTSQTIPQIQYEDLGLTLKATPTVTKMGAISLKLDLKVEALAGGSLDNIPILNNRQFVSDITIPDGETAVILSNVNRSEIRAINGIPGLSELPGFQNATEQMVEADSSQLVLMLTPHIVRRRPHALSGPRIAFTPARTAN